VPCIAEKPLILYPPTRFRLTKTQARGQLSKARLLRLERKNDVEELESEFSSQLEGSEAFLISSTPISDPGIMWVSSDDCKPPRFYKKLFATTAAAADIAAEACASPGASDLVFSFYLESSRISHMSSDISLPLFYEKSTWLGKYHHAFPSKTRTQELLGQLRYRKESILDLYKGKKEYDRRQHLQIIGFIYRDTLRFLLELAEINWHRES
jgi:hypothetical protein